MKKIGYKIISLSLFCITVSITVAIYYSNTPKGIMHGVFFGLPLALASVLLMIIFERLVKSKATKNVTNLCLTIVVIILITGFHRYYLIPSTNDLFIRIFQSTPATSLTDMELIAEYPGKDLMFRMKFSIDRTEIESLLVEFNKVRPEGTLTEGVLNSKDSLRSYLDIMWLRERHDRPWWNLEDLVYLQQYSWAVEHLWGALWLDCPEQGEECTVYIAGVW